MPVSEAPGLIKARATLEEIREHRNQAQDAEDALRAVLAQLLYQEAEILLSEEVIGEDLDRYQSTIQFRHFGEKGWSAAFNQLRPIPGRGLMVGFDVVDGRATIALASASQRCEYLFDLTYFDVQLAGTDH